MIGKNPITLDYNDFLKGMSTSDNVPDGGFSPSTDNVNLIASPGVIYQPTTMTDRSTNLTGNPIGSCGSTNSTRRKYIIAIDGKVLSMDTADGLTASAGTIAGTLIEGTTDIIMFGGKIFITTENNIARIDEDLTNINSTWWSVTATGVGAPFGILFTDVRHPMVQFQDYIWVGDSYRLHQLTSNSAGVKTKLSLSQEYNITALGVDVGSNNMLIGVQTTLDDDGVYPTESYIMTYDGISNQPIKTVRVDSSVTAFYNVGGTTYVTCGNKLGYWNGSGVSFLRKFKNVTLTNTDLAYKHHVTNVGNILYVIDGNQILAFGDILAGSKKFYYALKNQISSNKFKMICEVTSGKLGLGFDASKFYTFDPNSVASAGTADLYFNRINFPRPVSLREAYIEFNDAITDNVDIGSLFIIGDNQSTYTIDLLNDTGASVYSIRKKMLFNGIKFNSIQPRLNLGTSNKGIKRVVITYDPVE